MKHILIAVLVAFGLGGCKSESEKGDNSQGTSLDSVRFKDQKDEDQKTIIFFGNSITAGYGLEMEQAFPAIIQRWLDSLNYNYNVINAGLSGETSASGKNRIEWVLRTRPDIFLLELGGNDGLRGLSLKETPKNLQSIIDQVRTANPDVKILIAGMQVPPNLGQDYTEEFRKIFPELAQKNDVVLIPFLLDGVAGESNLNLADGIHPSVEGHKIVAKNVWQYLEPMLEKEEQAINSQ